MRALNFQTSATSRPLARWGVLVALALFGFVGVLAAGPSVAPAFAAGDVSIEEPILLTSAGQSPDVLMIRVLLNRAGIDAVTDEMADTSAMAGVRTLMFALGGSQKGLGAAGTDPDDELARVDALLKEAEANDVLVIGLHIGGEGRRGPLSERFIEPTVPRVHYLIVTEEGNRDGYFDRVSEQYGIGLTVVANTLDVGPVIEQLMAR